MKLPIINPGSLVTDITDKIYQYNVISEQEQTKRHIINKQCEALIEKIRADRDVFMQAVEQSFKERSGVYQGLFNLLDQGLNTNNPDIIQGALTGIVDQIK